VTAAPARRCAVCVDASSAHGAFLEPAQSLAPFAPRLARHAPARRCAVFASCAAALALLLALVPHARADEPEPPPEAGAGDYTEELADTLPRGWVETTFGARGTGSGAAHTSERVSFHAEDGSGVLRGGDPSLGEGWLAAPAGRGSFRLGRLAPRWGRGLLLGAAAEPWTFEPEDRGDRSALRGHAGDGAELRAGAAEMLAGRFGTRALAGVRAGAGPLALGVLASPRASAASLAASATPLTAELAIDPRGRWRAELALRRGRPGRTLALRVRGGLPGFASPAEPARAGPARVAAAQAVHAHARRTLRARAALWWFGPAAGGASASLEVQQRLVHHADVVFGCEEQHGTRRDPALTAVPAAAGMRQGFWCEWRGRVNGRGFTLRHELWGAGALARPALHRVLTARGESPLPWGASLAISQRAYSARGETLYLSEVDADRLVLHATSGTGARTRAELTLPVPGGRARAALEWTSSPGSHPAPAWTLEWSRRTRS